MSTNFMNLEVLSLEEIPEKATLIIGLPDVGLVGAIASSYLSTKMKMKPIIFIDSNDLPPVLSFHKEKPIFPLRMESNESFLVLLSEVALPVKVMPALARFIVKIIREKKIKKVIILGGIAVQNRMQIEIPKVYGIGLTKEDRGLLKNKGIEVLDEGFMAGGYAIIAKELIKSKINGIGLLAESHLTYPDPGAAASILGALKRLCGIEIDVKPLLEQAEELRLKLKSLMQKTMETLRESQKGYEHVPPILYR